MLNTPVALFIYKRPKLTIEVLTQISKVKPSTLLIIADGPRNKEEINKCNAARKIIEQVDWSCKILTNYSDVNLGCRKRVSSGLDWIFERHESAIILEDDCVPHVTFFKFCEILLERYRNDERIMMIGGSNPQFRHRLTFDSYYFSKYALIWGWATWRRAWHHYDVDMKQWPKLRNSSFLLDIHKSKIEAEHWKKRLEKAYAGHNTWDHQWSLACWLNNGFSILPNINLITNIGFGRDATHTQLTNDMSRLSVSTAPITFPLKHPSLVKKDIEEDRRTFQNIFG